MWHLTTWHMRKMAKHHIYRWHYLQRPASHVDSDVLSPQPVFYLLPDIYKFYNTYNVITESIWKYSSSFSQNFFSQQIMSFIRNNTQCITETSSLIHLFNALIALHSVLHKCHFTNIILISNSFSGSSIVANVQYTPPTRWNCRIASIK